jgi:hypothetical protein
MSAVKDAVYVFCTGTSKTTLEIASMLKNKPEFASFAPKSTQLVKDMTVSLQLKEAAPGKFTAVA